MFQFFKHKEKKTSFLHLYEKVVGWMESGEILTPEQNRYGKQSVYNYKKRMLPLQRYEAVFGTIWLEDIDINFGNNYTVFLHAEGYCKNTVGTNIAGVKAILNILYKKNLSRFNGTGISVKKELTTQVFNSIEEIQTLLDADFKHSPGRGIVRDVYVMQCFVGLRYSDFKKFLSSPETYLRRHGNKMFIDIKTVKTGETVVIPVANIVKDILEKYNYRFDTIFTYQYFNREIKVVAELAGLTQEIECTRTQGGERKDYVLRKCDMMSSHTARRTFATNATLSKDFPMPAIMKITGHRSVTNFEKYIRCNVLESAISVAHNDFFQIPFVLSATPEITEQAKEPQELIM